MRIRFLNSIFGDGHGIAVDFRHVTYRFWISVKWPVVTVEIDRE